MTAILGQRWERLYVAAGAIGAIAALASKLEFAEEYAEAQTSRAPGLVDLLCEPSRTERIACPRAQGIIDATRGDDLFVVVYVLLGIVAVTCLAGLRTWAKKGPRDIGRSGWLAIVLLVGAGVADVLENELLRLSAGVLGGRLFTDPDDAIRSLGAVPDHTVLAAAAKWCLLVGALVVVAWTVFGPPRVTARPHAVYHRPPRRPTAPGWDPPKSTRERVGICCSGGGIRSAAFSLGALQALRTQPQSGPLLGRAEYLSAVSGGGYLAAGLVVAEHEAKNHDPPVFAPGSPEERHFRDNASYLVPDVAKGALGISRLLVGLVLNLVLVWLVLFLIARPVGWAIHELHPSLRASTPVALTRDPVAALRVLRVDQVACTQGTACDTAEGVRAGAVLFHVILAEEVVPPVSPDAPAPKDDETPAVLLDLIPFDPGKPAECTYLVTDRRAVPRDTVEMRGRSPAEDRQATARHALVAVTASKAEIVRQPVVEVVAQPGRCAALGPTLLVDRQPQLTLRSSAVGPVPEDLQAELVVSTQPRVVSGMGLRGRDEIEIERWVWNGLGLLTGLAVALVLALVILRPSGTVKWKRMRAGARTRFPDGRSGAGKFLRRLTHKRTWMLWPAIAVTVADLCLFLLIVALPWLIQEMPKWLLGASGALDQAAGSAGTGLRDYLVPGGGVVFLVVTALRRYLSGAPDTEDGRTKVDSPGPLKRIWRWLSGRSQQLSWYELSPAKVLLGILLLVSFVVIFVIHLQYSSANGPSGRLMGMAILRERLPYALWLPEWKRYLLVLAGLVLFERVVDAHSWSLQPFYKRRLSFAYLEGRRAKQTFDDGPLRFDEIQPDNFPQLVVGCAVNLSEVGRVPPGRRAASFTFSSTEIGGPLVGYVPTSTYWDRMRRARQKDITVPGAMAISGAAFSPAMGKKNLGPVGAIMALANLRLGVWLPHPQYVEASGANSWIHRPGASWFMRELLNRYHFDKPYLYVSDGGHWENLGLVELLRRGCTKIVCINAGGDSQRAFGTIGEAVALAREELGVEFYDFDPSPLRPPLQAASSGRLLRREIARDKAEPLATASYVCGRFRYPVKNKERREGRIWLIEPALTADIPFDVHVFAESEAIFPDDSTADQVFNHRQFEAFRALGFHQACKAAADPVFSDLTDQT